MKITTYLDLKRRKEKKILKHSTCLIDGEFWRKYCYKQVDVKWRVKWKSKKKSSNKLKDSKLEPTKEDAKEGGSSDASDHE